MNQYERTRVRAKQTQRTSPRHRPLVVLGFMLMAGTVVGAEAGEDTALFQPDAAAQSAIAAYVQAENDAERVRALDEIESLASLSRQEFVRQLAAYASGAHDVKSAMASGVLIERLAISDRTIVEAVIPLLEDGESEWARAAERIISGIEKQSAGRRPDFSVYREILADRLRADSELPLGLIRHMYRTDPGEALLALMRAHQLRDPDEIKPIIWAEHVVADCLWKQRNGFLRPDEAEPAAAQELATLADHPQWWVRLFVAETMRQNASLRQIPLVDKLQTDPHVLVRESAQATAEPR